MVELAQHTVQLSGDIGGVGVSKFHWQRKDATTPLQADCDSAGAALRALYNACIGVFPSAMSYQVLTEVPLFDVASALVSGILVMSSTPAVVTGGGGLDYAAGTGARINWKTTSIHNRRYLRGATFMVPLVAGAYTGQGAVAGATITTIQSAAATFLTALDTANLELIAWHRPAKGATTGGAAGLVFTGQVPSTPAGLRSRRS
jgi:hypothetical protein